MPKTKNSRIVYHAAWRCSCGVETWALQLNERDYRVGPHARRNGAPCEKSATVQQASP
jgi:hypothetical protein